MQPPFHVRKSLPIGDVVNYHNTMCPSVVAELKSKW